MNDNELKLNHLHIFMVFFLIGYMIISDVLINWLNYSSYFLQYSDELSVLIICFMAFISGLRHKVRVDRRDIKNLKIICLIFIIGMMSNYFSKLQPSIGINVTDYFLLIKIFLIFISLKIILNKKDCEFILKKLFILAKLFIIVSTIFGIVSLFVDIGMSNSIRFGIRSFCFIFGSEHAFSVYILISFLIVICNNCKNKKFYCLLTMLCELLTTKGPSIIVAVLFMFIFIYFKKHKKISIWMIMLIGAVSICFGMFQIQNYLLNSNAPRYLFFKYGFITANKYFPLGSGFSTFGSNMAAKNYSRLYYEYGFSYLHGMGPIDGAFLFDTYWPMIIGQFGYIGLLLTLLIFWNLYKEIISISNKNVKSVLFVTLLYFLIHSIGSSILTSSTGVLGFAFMALALQYTSDVK